MPNELFLNTLKEIDPPLIERYKNLALLVASSLGDLQTVQYLVEQKKANVNARQQLEFDQLGSDQERQDVIRYFKEIIAQCEYARAPTPLCTSPTSTPLHTAMLFGHYEIAHYLLQQGADIEARYQNSSGTDKVTLLYVFSERDSSAQALHFLLQHQANVETCDAYGNRPLHRACFYRHFDKIKYLIDAGADSTALATHNGQPPIYFIGTASKENKDFGMKVKTYIAAHQKLASHPETLVPSKQQTSTPFLRTMTRTKRAAFCIDVDAVRWETQS